MEENRRFSWSDLFIKAILVIIFVLFTVWLLSLSNKGVTNSLNVLTDEIFAKNIERMKEVGKEYFTIERLPEKVGEVKTLTLEKMYEKKLILELKDKNGNACSAKDSYVSIEKYDTEYQMKVYLECGEESDYIIVIMGCYDYCDSDICEKQEDKEEVKEIEYQYKKTTGGKWTDYGKWSEWSKVSVTETNYRQVETKVVDEEYSYDKTVTETIFTQDALCPTISGLTLVSNNNGVCTYKKPVYVSPLTCPTKTGFTVVQNGFGCTYTKTVTTEVSPNACASTLDGGWTLTGRSGLTCNYKRTVTSKKEYDIVYSHSGNGYPPSDTEEYHYEIKSSNYVYECAPTCGGRWVYTYNAYKKVYKTSTETKSTTVTCPSGADVSGNSCLVNSTETNTSTVSCPAGYSKNENKCVKYEQSTKTATCSVSEKMDNGKCYKDVEKIVTVTGTRKVTHYRYRVREYVGGTVDYKWSTSKNDKKLLDAGYKLTGKTR